MKRHALIALLTLLFAVHYVPATATLRNWTGDLPLEQFSDEDRSVFRASLKDALEHKPDGETPSNGKIPTRRAPAQSRRSAHSRTPV